jgi:uncharacterized protein (DUF4415 family)
MYGLIHAVEHLAEDGKMFGDRINWILREANAE